MRQYWVSPIPPLNTTDSSYTGTAALGDFSPSPGIVLPANILEIGSRIRIEAFGKYTSTGTPGTVVLGTYIGTGAISSGQAMCATAATTVGTSKTNQSWSWFAYGTVRTLGSTGTILGAGEAHGIAGGTTIDGVFAPLTGQATLSIDTTAALKVMMGATPSVTTGTWVCSYFSVELLS